MDLARPRPASVLITFAVPEEARPFQTLPPARTQVSVVITGIGPDAARQSVSNALDRLQPGLVLSCGFAGGLNPSLPSGEIVYQTDTAPALSDTLRLLGTAATFTSVPHPVQSVEAKRQLRASTGADAVDMESATILSLARQAGLPCAIIRVISDAADQPLPLDFGRCVDRQGRVRPARVLLQCARRPTTIPALLRLRTITRLAARQLAATLTRVLSTLP